MHIDLHGVCQKIAVFQPPSSTFVCLWLIPSPMRMPASSIRHCSMVGQCNSLCSTKYSAPKNKHYNNDSRENVTNHKCYNIIFLCLFGLKSGESEQKRLLTICCCFPKSAIADIQLILIRCVIYMDGT